jgi:hypothetical protein
MTNQNQNFRDINRAIQQDAANSPGGYRSSDWQKIVNDDAPPFCYLSTKGATTFILPPPHPAHNSSLAITSGGIRGDKRGGNVPTLGQYGLDWVMVYRKVGNSEDDKKRRDILAINMVEGPDGPTIQVEREWGNGYRSPMYKLYEYLWKTAGAHKFDANVRRAVPTLAVDPTSAKVKRAMQLVPPDSNGGGKGNWAPLSRGKRTMLLSGFVIRNGERDLTIDEDNNPCWPQHRIMYIDQVTAIKSREGDRHLEGFYDHWFERTDGLTMAQACDMDVVRDRFGEIYDDVDAQLAWEAGFRHADFATNQKLVTWSSYKGGAAGIDTYCCTVENLATALNGYSLPEEILMKARPIADYLANNTEQLQIQWLLEAFPGDEWALEGAGLIEIGRSVSVPSLGSDPAEDMDELSANAHEHGGRPVAQQAPAKPVARPQVPVPPQAVRPSAVSVRPVAPAQPVARPQSPAVPMSPAQGVTQIQIPPAPGVTPIPNPPVQAVGGSKLSSSMKDMMQALRNKGISGNNS